MPPGWDWLEGILEAVERMGLGKEGKSSWRLLQESRQRDNESMKGKRKQTGRLSLGLQDSDGWDDSDEPE